jgi:hypothetical protein
MRSSYLDSRLALASPTSHVILLARYCLVQFKLLDICQFTNYMQLAHLRLSSARDRRAAYRRSQSLAEHVIAEHIHTHGDPARHIMLVYLWPFAVDIGT